MALTRHRSGGLGVELAVTMVVFAGLALGLCGLRMSRAEIGRRSRRRRRTSAHRVRCCRDSRHENDRHESDQYQIPVGQVTTQARLQAS